MARLLPISDCSQCPKLRTERHHTGDSWEVVFKWICTGLGVDEDPLIGYEEDRDKPEIPNWCPLPEAE